MNLSYVLDYRFSRTPDGAIWTDTSYDAAFWNPYLRVFDRVQVISRVQEVEAAKAGWKRVDSDRVAVAAVPYYLGPLDYARRRRAVHGALRQALNGPAMVQPTVVLLRVPSQLSNCAAAELKRLDKPYGVEVVGDAKAALARGVVGFRGRRFFQWWFARKQREQCWNARSVTYVSRSLAESYPNRTGSAALICSDVRIGSDWLRAAGREYGPGPATRLVTVATLSQTYKGIDVLLEALYLCAQQGLRLQLMVIGEGKYRGEFERHTEALGLSSSVTFAGAVPWGQALIRALDQADVFVLPSRVEALPRALLEAMARALPCVASKVGAIPEVLDAGALVSPGDASLLADRLTEVCGKAEVLKAMSRRNLEVARTFALDRLQPRWLEFYQSVAARHSGQDASEAVREMAGVSKLRARVASHADL